MDAAKLLRNRVHQESSSRGREKINAVSKNYDFCENGQLYNSAENTVFWARSNFNGFANFGPLMTNDGAFESSHQGEVIFGHIVGVMDNYKKVFVEGKQTVSCCRLTYRPESLSSFEVVTSRCAQSGAC